MSDPLEFIPGYVSPLTEMDHARIGRIAILWGQIEHFVEIILPHVTGLSWDELIAIRVADKPIATKVDLLNQARNRLADDDIAKKVRDFCASINDTKVQRNHLFHGLWGWRASGRTQTVVPAARKTSNPDQPLKAAQLPGLEKRLCQCSRIGIDLVMHFHSEGYRVKYSRYLHHDGQEAAPEWLQQWAESHPLDDVALDRSSKPGRLPHLEQPNPHK